MPPTWHATMIGPDEDFAGAPLLRTEFSVETGHGAVTGAQLHATARGVFTAFVGGAAVSDEVLSPGWSSYEWRLRYRTYDVAALLPDAGETAVLGFALGNGWYRGRLGWGDERAIYGPELGVLAQLEITFADGHRQFVGTDGSWRAGPSAVQTNDLYDGQTIDARLVDDAWLRPGAAGSGWTGVHAQEFDAAILAPYVGPVVRRQQEVSPTRIWTSPAGGTLVDFGQNLVGWLRLAVRGEAGATVTVRHAEVLEDGELGTRPLRSAQATDRFVLSGADDVFEPTLTFHGFRYAELDGWPGVPTTDAITAVVVHSDLRRTGRFRCSDELVNQLHDNVVWGMRGNFLDVPTDCPQRDERMGWTGDIAAFAPSAAFLYDVADFLGDWLLDVDAEQRAAEGLIPYVVPDVLKYTPPGDLGAQESTAVWGDAAVWVPWALWRAYGDRDALDRAYGAMAAHVRRVETLLSDTGLWDTGFQFGDWLDPTAPPDDPIRAKADNGVVATACLYRSARTASEAAAVLGRGGDAEHFAGLAERTRSAFVKHYVGDDGRIRSDAVTAYALAIHFGLLDDRVRGLAGDRLAALVAESGHRIATGFAGTPYVCDALVETGHLDDAYRLLLQRDCPSWLYPVTMGATTVWERWDSMLPDGTINPGQMTSFNHYALGAVADWLHRTVGGIAPAEPGYRTVRVAPRPGGGLTWAECSLQTPHGLVAVAWRVEPSGALDVEVAVPDGVTAEIDVPGAEPQRVGAGSHRFRAGA
ncbi:alpha-L-rhamnosidase [Pseudonocardia humida]|uniref:alpha-L-rhamnosidase n=1 Tax=Pseudonocardia humida TaxID=2800819 RepID=A0ABT1AD81_9PSEU|nr:alpha-L-rhamnosidase [Pseudonocardia humida]MCO1660832.1 family 78 glycoside hydrolase catalytic domain [Pseudonocardia humida]MCO1661030.1 family 78 glycoside hydrolase catalytic domain [Pseudonocardia humida]